MRTIAFLAAILWAKVRVNALALTPRHFGWQVYEITETGPQGRFFRVGLVKFNGKSDVVDRRLVARIEA